VRARAALRTLLGEIWLQPNGDHLVAHVELQNQALALVSGNVANGGSGGALCELYADRDRALSACRLTWRCHTRLRVVMDRKTGGHRVADPLQTFDPDFDPAALRAIYVHDQQQDGPDE